MPIGHEHHRRPSRACLDQRLQRVGVIAQHQRAERSVARQRPEPAGRVRCLQLGGATKDPAPHHLEPSLEPGEIRQRPDAPVPDHQLRALLDDRRDQRRDIGRAVLIVGVRVDDDVRTRAHRGFESRSECRGKPPVPVELHHMTHAVRSCDFGGSILAAIVDHQPLDDVDTWQ
jgi:hypothetical protein